MMSMMEVYDTEKNIPCKCNRDNIAYRFEINDNNFTLCKYCAADLKYLVSIFSSLTYSDSDNLELSCILSDDSTNKPNKNGRIYLS